MNVFSYTVVQYDCTSTNLRRHCSLESDATGWFHPKREKRREGEGSGVPGAGDAVDEAVDAVAGDAAFAHDLLGDGHVDGLQRRERVALDLYRPAVLPLAAHRAHVALEHRHLVPLPPRRQRQHQPRCRRRPRAPAASACPRRRRPATPPARRRRPRPPAALPPPPWPAPAASCRWRRRRSTPRARAGAVLRLLVGEEREARLGGGGRGEERHGHAPSTDDRASIESYY